MKSYHLSDEDAYAVEIALLAAYQRATWASWTTAELQARDRATAEATRLWHLLTLFQPIFYDEGE